MNLKPSRFNTLVSIDADNTLLFNAKNTSLVVLDADNRYILDETDRLEAYDHEVVDHLIDMGFLVSEDLDEMQTLQLQQNKAAYNSDTLFMTIAVTLDCNMACPYCYETKTGQFMDEKTAHALVAFVENQMDDYKRLHITWTGGEPLLAMDTIQTMSQRFIDICTSRSLEYYASIITNGVLLTEATSETLGRICKVRDFQITVDGMPETHNKRRLMKDKSESFDTIVKNIRGALPYAAITLRMNIDKENAKESSELVEYFYETEGYKDHPGFMFSIKNVKSTNQYDDHCYSCHDFVPLYEALMPEFLTPSKIEKYFPKSTNMSCGAQCMASFAVDPAGDLFKCYEEVGQADHKVGDVFSGVKVNKRNLDYMFMPLPQACNDCGVLPLCQGGCPVARMENGNEPICSSTAKTLESYLRQYYDQWLKEE